MYKLYEEVKKKFDTNFKSNLVRNALKFNNNQIEFMSGTEISIIANLKNCIVQTESGKINIDIENKDFDEKVSIIVNTIFVIVDIVTFIMGMSLEMLAVSSIKIMTNNSDDNISKKELLN